MMSSLCFLTGVECWIVLNETNTDVHICTLEEFISSRCSHIVVQG